MGIGGMSLVNYSSSDEDPALIVLRQTNNIKQNVRKKQLLPKALNLLGACKADADIVDDSIKHEGRIRSFRHERGNWATHVYIPVDSEIMEDVQQMCQNMIKVDVQLHQQTDLHISLSKTVVLQFHLIQSFCKSLKRSLAGILRFTVSLHLLKIYTNEEKTRTFVGFEVSSAFFEKLNELISAVDGVMEEHKLAKFYEHPSFHVSLLWAIGDHVETLSERLADIRKLMHGEFKVDINEIHCKMGNKKIVCKLLIPN